jgi:hypothetical protein
LGQRSRSREASGAEGSHARSHGACRSARKGFDKLSPNGFRLSPNGFRHDPNGFRLSLNGFSSNNAHLAVSALWA